MEPLFTAKNETSFKEYIKFSFAIENKLNKSYIINLIIAFALGIIFGVITYIRAGHDVVYTLVIAVSAVLLFLVFDGLLFAVRSLQSYFKTDRKLKQISFFTDDFCTHGANGEIYTEYKNIYKVIKNKKNIYIFNGADSGLIIKKSACSQELLSFVEKDFSL